MKPRVITEESLRMEDLQRLLECGDPSAERRARTALDMISVVTGAGRNLAPRIAWQRAGDRFSSPPIADLAHLIGAEHVDGDAESIGLAVMAASVDRMADSFEKIADTLHMMRRLG